MTRFFSWLLLAAILLSFSCAEKEKPVGNDTDFLLSYISIYVDDSLAIQPRLNNGGAVELQINQVNFGSCPIYTAPEVGGHGDGAEKFLRIAARNRDRTYNKEEGVSNYLSRKCLAESYKSIEIICLNRDWDAAHPKGNSLNDIAKWYFRTYAEFVKAGYPQPYLGENGSGENYLPFREKYLNELTESDLAMFAPDSYVRFDTRPAAGEYQMQLTVVTTEGVSRSSTCILRN